MRDYLLFAVAPYVALLAFVSVCAVRYVVWQGGPRQADAPRRRGDNRVSRMAWRAALAVVAFGHLMAFFLPDYVLEWDRQLARMVVVEVAGVVAGGLATAGLLDALLRRLRAQRRGDVSSSPFDIVAGTLGLIATMSGVGIAVLYRWASSWAEVTLAPYVRSLARFDPSITLVTHLPLLVKLHVVCAFVLLMALPFSDLSRLVVAPADRLARRACEPMAGLARAARSAAGARITTLAHACSARLLRNGAEEN
jgi:respiratory nitrate reductase gamma subunit